MQNKTLLSDNESDSQTSSVSIPQHILTYIKRQSIKKSDHQPPKTSHKPRHKPTSKNDENSSSKEAHPQIPLTKEKINNTQHGSPKTNIKRTKYTLEQKLAVVEEALSVPRNVYPVARKYGLGDSVVYQWIKEKDEMQKALEEQIKNGKKKTKKELREEKKAMRKEENAANCTIPMVKKASFLRKHKAKFIMNASMNGNHIDNSLTIKGPLNDEEQKLYAWCKKRIDANIPLTKEEIHDAATVFC